MTTHDVVTVFEAERARLALQTRRGFGMPLAGMVYWLVVAVLVRVLPQPTAMMAMFFATGAVFPLGALLTRLVGGDLFARHPTLTSLGLILAAVQLFYWPVIVLIYRVAPEWTPWTMALLFGSHFLPYLWLYRSRAYAFLASATAVVLSLAAIVTRSPLYHEAPLIAAGCYALAVAMLWVEVRRSRATVELAGQGG